MFFIFVAVLHREHIKNCAAEVGFTLCGVARARVLAEHAELYARALAASGDGALGYLARDPARRLDPSRLVEGAGTVIVCAVSYRNLRSGFLGYPEGFASPKIASYALSGTYQPKIRGMLARMAAMLGLPPDGDAGRGRTWFAASDTSAIIEKAWAVEAGLGWVGRNSLLVTPRHGSFLLLGELIVADECDACDEPYSGPGCGSCRRCVDACPAGALVPQPPAASAQAGATAPHVAPVCALDTRRCISALTIEKTPEPVDPDRLHGWIFGCDECQNLCPHNRLAPRFDNPLFTPRFDPADFSASEWRAMTPARFVETFADTPLERAGVERMKKNVARTKKEDDLF